jgi:SAM-dependent methyltransferase
VPSELAGVPQLDREEIDRKAELDRRHWWYRGRRAVVRAALTRLPVERGREALEVGCGTGQNLAWLSDVGPARGIEVNPAAVELARKAGHEVDVGNGEALPYADGRFGLLACLDVLEHVSDDEAALAEMRRVTQAGGVLLLTVPAYPRLFSGHDEAAGHRRRYTSRRLLELTHRTGWEPSVQTHFNLILLPAAVAGRLGARLASRRGRERAPRSDLLRTPPALDGVLQWPMRAEASAIRAGVRLPWGLSILLGLRAVSQPRR